MPPFKPISERILALSMPEPVNGCWLWIGCIDKCGYGKMGAHKNGVRHPETLAHRFSYTEFVGQIPEGCEIDHICNNRRCVNPDHLRAITHAANVGRADYTLNHRNGRKTHCKRGHELSGKNVLNCVVEGKPRRKCKACSKMMKKRRLDESHSDSPQHAEVT